MKNTFLARSIRLFFFICLSVVTHIQAQVKEIDIHLENYEYPFPVKFLSTTAQNQSLKMAYMDVMPESFNGKTVMLFHGKNFNGAYWKQTAEALLKKGYRVFIPDQVGFGKSTKPECFQYSFQQLASLTKVLLDSLQIKTVSLLGHSMGGMLAARFTLMYPETVNALILLNPIGLEDYKLKVPYQSINALYQKELQQTYESMKKYQLQSYYDNQWKPAYDEWLNINADMTLNKQYPLVAYNNALTTDMVMSQPVVYELQNIKVPTLLIIGQRDKAALGKDLVSPKVAATMGNYPKLGLATQQKIRNSKLVKIEGIGHLPHIEAFDKFFKPFLQFLNQKTFSGNVKH